MRRALRELYGRHFAGEAYIEPSLFEAVSAPLRRAVEEALPEEDGDDGRLDSFRHALLHSADVFAAFKVHTTQCSMASRMLDPDGNLKSFEQWSNDVRPIASHQFGPWLRTEYDTAVIRAHQAADWQQFERYKDVLPNLRWVPSTSPNPGQDHLPYWGTVLPVDHPFWSHHRPGDRWNCKCSLEATDEPATSAPSGSSGSDPHKGLDSNPGTTAQLFSQSHPYFPDSCAACPFASGLSNRLSRLFTNRKPDCTRCANISRHLPQADSEGFVRKNRYDNGGELLIHERVDKKKADYKAIVNIAQAFAKAGEQVRITPAVHRKSPEYQSIYGSLIGTKYENKCPDFKVGDKFYEYEGFVKPWTKDKVGRMLSHGLMQSPYIVINNTNGCSHRFLRKRIYDMIKVNKTVSEVWVYEKGNIKRIF